MDQHLSIILSVKPRSTKLGVYWVANQWGVFVKSLLDCRTWGDKGIQSIRPSPHLKKGAELTKNTRLSVLHGCKLTLALVSLVFWDLNLSFCQKKFPDPDVFIRTPKVRSPWMPASKSSLHATALGIGAGIPMSHSLRKGPIKGSKVLTSSSKRKWGCKVFYFPRSVGHPCTAPPPPFALTFDLSELICCIYTWHLNPLTGT